MILNLFKKINFIIIFSFLLSTFYFLPFTSSANSSNDMHVNLEVDGTITPPPPPPPTGGGGGTGTISGGKPAVTTNTPHNPTNVTAQSVKTGILISWTNPTDSDFSYIRIMENTGRYYSSPFDGVLIYEGNGEHAIDHFVIQGNKYFYTLFSRSSNGDFSSGALVSATYVSPSISKPSSVPITSQPVNEGQLDNPLVPKTGQSYPTLPQVDYPALNPIVSESSYDYTITQDGQILPFPKGQVFTLSPSSPFIVTAKRHDAESNVKDLWINISDESGQTIGQYFFAAHNGINDVEIPDMQKVGNYIITVIAYDSSNDSPLLQNRGTIKVLHDAPRDHASKSSNPYFYLLVYICFIAFICLISWLIWKIFSKFSQ